MTVNIDSDENVDWLHPKQTQFTVLKDSKEVGRIDLESNEIETGDSELEEYFYLLIDEGIGEGPITDGPNLVDALRKQNYEVKVDA